MKVDITLYRGDLLPEFEDLELNEVTPRTTKIPTFLIAMAESITFMDTDGKYKMLKERNG